jgi:hypothetical protein
MVAPCSAQTARCSASPARWPNAYWSAKRAYRHDREIVVAKAGEHRQHVCTVTGLDFSGPQLDREGCGKLGHHPVAYHKIFIAEPPLHPPGFRPIGQGGNQQ